MAEKHANIEELVYDDHNFNQHTAEGMELLEKSIRENKFGRSILIDKDNRIIAGNGIVEAATKTGTKKIRVIETDGDELIAVKRKDLSLDSTEGRRLALADNATSAANLKWDEEELKILEGFDVPIGEWGVEMPKIWNKEKKENAEVPFSEVLNEEHNYICLYFDNSVDWLQACSLFGLERVRSLSTRKGGDNKAYQIGLGRVVNGAQAIERIFNFDKK